MTISAGESRRRFTSRDVYRMVESGIITEGERVELLSGELVLREPQSPYHAALTERIRKILERAYGDGYHTRTHSPLDLGTYNQPEPDIAVIRGRVEDFLARHPSASDVVLVVEIAVTSQRIDRNKAALYARAGVDEYWLVDLVSRAVEVRRQPALDGSYSDFCVPEDGTQIAVPETGNIVTLQDLLIRPG